MRGGVGHEASGLDWNRLELYLERWAMSPEDRAMRFIETGKQLSDEERMAKLVEEFRTSEKKGRVKALWDALEVARNRCICSNSERMSCPACYIVRCLNEMVDGEMKSEARENRK